MNKSIYKQMDTRWRYWYYPTSKYNVGNSGCGLLACFHIAIEQKAWADQPVKTALNTLRQYMVQYATCGNGTLWKGIPATLKHLGHENVVWVDRDDPMSHVFKECDKGRRIGIILFYDGCGPDRTEWTSSGHYIAFLKYKVDELGKHWFYLKDSGGRGHDKWWCYETSMKGCVGHVFITERIKAKKKSNKPYQNLKESSFVANRVIIGQACCDERGRLQGGKAGDQAKEVRYSYWAWSESGAYNWRYVFRAKDKYTRLVIAQAMRDCYKNQHIGYDIGRPDRFTAYDEAASHDWNIKKIDKDCETTCSQAVSMCLRAAGISKDYAPRFCNIAVMTDVLPKCPQFKVYRSKKYCAKSTYLQPGDILLSPSHTVIVTKAPKRR